MVDDFSGIRDIIDFCKYVLVTFKFICLLFFDIDFYAFMVLYNLINYD